ncbi:ABC transporter ATP-binding protein [Ruficoccus sp. ZRK36]|uniref:ABC transporter ATP-binding protein n=1 Tax=Ruficoccus sp. ZRK36 TaxID=2866311 RepID=UPI001C733F70|nr:ABC transporter ATP-binding protein [Ruficoccus sp. ZRK36]QYY37398.1 ABC transporter ATP-binding protein/permease [Ruficoccus sp. ZRK36]
MAFTCGLIYSVLSGFGLPVITEKVIKNFLHEAGKEAIEVETWKIIGVAALLPLVFAIRGISNFFSSYLMSICSWRSMKQLRNDIFHKLQQLPISYFDSRSTGDTLTRIGSDTGRVQTVVMEVLTELLRQPFIMISGISALVYLSWDSRETAFFLGFIAAAFCFAIPVILLRKKLKRRGKQLQESYASMTQMTKENLDAVQEVRAFNLEDQQRMFYNIEMDKYIQNELKMIKYQRMQNPIMEIMSITIIAGLFLYAYYSNIDYGTFAGLGFALYMTLDPLKKILNIVNNFHSSHASFDRLEQTLQLENPITDPENPVTVNKVRGSVTFENVSFEYKVDTPVLEDISVTIPAGQHCALVGPSGSGKSTFMKLIPRLYDPTSGTIQIDDIASQDMRLADLRNQIALVSQHPVLFNISLLENIRLGRPGATDEEVMQAAREAYAHDFISDFKEGYNTSCGENGRLLSGGQKQRIAIARAILRDAPILLLDEATSALDAESEACIQSAIDKLVKNRTVITIAHRRSTFKHAERLLVFDGGKIVASGTHEELMLTSPVFQKLVTNQS